MDPIFLVKRRRFLTREEEAEILMKKASGKFTDKELAQQYGVCRETIVRVKKRWSPTMQAAQVYAQSKALEIQKKRVAAIGQMSGPDKYSASTDFLERLEVVKPKAVATKNQGRQQVQIIVGGFDDHDEAIPIRVVDKPVVGNHRTFLGKTLYMLRFFT